MELDLQKANIGKRISAYLFDIIILSIVAVGIAFLLSGILKYDQYNRTLEEAYSSYETQYGINFELTQEEFDTMTEEYRARYDEAYEALTADNEAMFAYHMATNLALLILTLSILVAHIVL